MGLKLLNMFKKKFNEDDKEFVDACLNRSVEEREKV